MIAIFSVLFFLVSVLSLSEFVVADSHDLDNNEFVEEDSGENEIVDGLDVEFSDAELERGAGITPDSGFYFVEDSVLSKFRDDSGNREKKIAEIRAMVTEGNYEAARKALSKYKGFADEFEKEVDPEKRQEARRSAAAIRNTIHGLEDDIPEEYHSEFVDEILDNEERIVTAVEIAGKIRDLCKTLASLDPNEYARVCSSNEDSPDWQKRLDKDLSEQQREEALKFGEIMEQCFRTSGQECRCEDIPFQEFAAACSEAAPLAKACDVDNDEGACDALDELEMPELPDHLQDVFDDLEKGIGEASFDHHIPRACAEAGITGEGRNDREECAKIMIQTEAPEECRDALLESNVQSEREGREICEKIMFEIHAPEECVQAVLENDEVC